MIEIRFLIEQGTAKTVDDPHGVDGKGEILSAGTTEVYARLEDGAWVHKSFQNNLSIKHTKPAERAAFLRRAIVSVADVAFGMAGTQGVEPVEGWKKATPPK